MASIYAKRGWLYVAISVPGGAKRYEATRLRDTEENRIEAHRRAATMEPPTLLARAKVPADLPMNMLLPLEPTEPGQGVYFIQDEGSRLIKIGTALDPLGRLKELQCGSAHKLRLVGVIHGGRRTEGLLHRRFGAARFRGEWFHPTPELLEFVRDKDTRVSNPV